MNYLKHGMAAVECPTPQRYQKWNLTRLSKPVEGHGNVSQMGPHLTLEGEGKQNKKDETMLGQSLFTGELDEVHPPTLCFILNLCYT